MLFKNISILDGNLELKENMYVGIKGDKIDYIGSESPKDLYDYIADSSIYDGKGKLLMSAFYNTHTHSAMTLMRGYGEGLCLQEWLNDRIFPFEDKLDGNAVYRGTQLALAESIASGIVSSTDMYYFPEDMARAVDESGAKMNISRAVVHFDGSDPRESVRFKEMANFIKDYDGTSMGRLIAEASIHAEYTSNPAAVTAVAEFADAQQAGVHVHLSETIAEHEECKARHGKTPARYFYDLGLFDQRTTAAHCVWLEEEDYGLLAEKKVSVATCTASNMKLASGLADACKVLKNGINLTIGTDSVSSNNNLNFFEEMKLTALAAKIKTGEPTAVSTHEILKAATEGGALSQGRKNCGKLKVGNKADIIVLNIDKENMQPIHDIKTNIVYSADPSNVVMTMADGKVLYKDGEFKTIDIEKTIFEVRRATEKILGEL